MEVSRRHPDPYLGSWRDSLYQLPHPLHHPLHAHHHHARGHPPGHHRPEFTKRQAPLPPLINKDRKPRRKTEDSFVMASAYKAFNQHEKSRKVHHPSSESVEKRKLLRKSYDSTGPNDERYYVSASSGIGTDGSKGETDSSGREEDGNIFVKLLQNQVLNYKSDRNSPKREKKKLSRDSFYERQSVEQAPPSPTPDYSQHRVLANKKLISKSISSLLEDKDEVNLCKKLSESSLELRSSPSIPLPDYEEEGVRKKSPVLKSPRNDEGGNVWSNVERYKGETPWKERHNNNGVKHHKIVPTETLKEVIKHRPPVSEVVREITKESEKDKLRQREREMMQKEIEKEFSADSKDVEKDDDSDEAQQIYREIIDVVSANSPSSLQYVRGRMVGYGEEAATLLRQGDRRHAAVARRPGPGVKTRLRLSEDRASVTTSIDSYPFSPSSPWAQALPSRYNRYGYPVFPQKNFGLPSPSGPVSFAGFSSPSSQLTTSSFAPASMIQVQQQPPGRGKMKRKKKWFNIF